MKKVLTTFAIAFAVVLAVSIDCPIVLADYADDVGSPPVEGVQVPPGGQGISGVCGGDGDPDDLGGGFRSTTWADQANQRRDEAAGDPAGRFDAEFAADLDDDSALTW